jgi:hypothetical protein
MTTIAISRGRSAALIAQHRTRLAAAERLQGSPMTKENELDCQRVRRS